MDAHDNVNHCCCIILETLLSTYKCGDTCLNSNFPSTLSFGFHCWLNCSCFSFLGILVKHLRHLARAYYLPHLSFYVSSTKERPPQKTKSYFQYVQCLCLSISLSFTIHKYTLCTMCCIFPHVYTSKNRLLLFSTKTFTLVPLSAVSMCECYERAVYQYVLLSVSNCECERVNAAHCAGVCIYVCVCVCLYLFRAILNTIGIVKYLEGGVFIHDCCCCKEQ